MKLELRPTADAELDFVLALERDPENTPFIGQWSRDEHRDAIARQDRAAGNTSREHAVAMVVRRGRLS